MIKIFIDFDGTITKKDVGDSMFIEFGGEASRNFIQQYRSGEISAIECFKLESEASSGAIKKDLDDFLDKQEIDVSFIEFHKYCGDEGIPHFILSDGMDYYIERILKRFGLNNIPFFSNHLDLTMHDGTDEVILNPTFPLRDEECDRCACCKRNIMLSKSADDDIIVYIGEGFSDRCPVRYADVVFAKDELLIYCQQENISFFEYRSFAEVKIRLESLLTQKSSKKNFGLRKRRQAQLAVRDLLLGG
ncbi:MAG: MtnX-like HAD-IB family phosphatase [Ignavibacteriales bacterium]|nr:MtnX-like HAD-IB family phosphatase [Ignavibacteriales bacterium]